MSTGVGPDSQQFVQIVVQGFVTENYINFAILAVLLHDTAAYLEEEVKYFWAKPKSVVSILYFVIRYVFILMIVSELFINFFNERETMCRVLYLQNILFATPILCVDYILFLRVRALYSQSRMITKLLISIFCLEALALIGIAIHGSVLLDPSVVEFNGLSVCSGNSMPTVEYVSAWCIPLVYSTLLMILALYKARQFWKESAGYIGFNLVKLLIRDQGFYFLTVNIVCIANLLSIAVDMTSFGGFVLTVAGSSSLLSLIGSRLLINMKEAGEKGLNQGISYSLKSVRSNIDFASSPRGVPQESVEVEIQSDV